MKKILILCAAAAMTLACNDKNKNQTPDYGPEVTVSTPAAAQDAINKGSTDITISEPLSATASFTIPKNYAPNKIVSLTADANGQDITIAEGAGSSGLPTLDLNIADSKNLTLETPDMSVIVNGDVTGTLSASTAANTLTISADATVNELVVLKGNVRLLGTVTTMGSVADESNILYPVATVEELRERMTVTPYDHITNGGVVLTADISAIVTADTEVDGTPAISGSQDNQDVFRLGAAPTETQPEPPYSGYIIDGDGHTLSGAGYNNVLAIYANDVTINNLAVVQTGAEKETWIVKDGALAPANNAGISLYGVTGATLSNVSVSDCGKYGLIVNGSEATVDNFAGSGNSFGGINVDKGSGLTSIPSLTLVSADITGTNAVVVDYAEAVVSVPEGWTSVTEEGVTIYSPPASE